MKYIITEEQNIRLKILRKRYLIDELVEYRLKMYKTMSDKDNVSVCQENEKYFFDVVKDWVINNMSYSSFGIFYGTTDEWKIIRNTMEKHIDSTYKTIIEDFFHSICKNQ
jgi:hypothetical protein